MNGKSIETLKSENLPRANAAFIGVVPKEGVELSDETREMLAAIDEYFGQFVAVDNSKASMLLGVRCISCDTPLGGALGSFQYGIVHGEGQCGKCGYPCRANHYPKDSRGEIFEGGIQKVLQYHPDLLGSPQPAQ